MHTLVLSRLVLHGLQRLLPFKRFAFLYLFGDISALLLSFSDDLIKVFGQNLTVNDVFISHVTKHLVLALYDG